MFLIREGYSCRERGVAHKGLGSKGMVEVLDKELEPATKLLLTNSLYSNQMMIFDLKEHYLVV